MKQRILDYFRYEMPDSLLNTIFIGFLGLLLIGSLTITVIITKEIQYQEKSILQLQHEIDSIRSKMEFHRKTNSYKSFPNEKSSFPTMNYWDMP